MNVDDLFRRLAARDRKGDPPALVAGSQAWTGARLLAAVDAQAGVLARAGVRVLASLLENGPDWVITDLAALRAGIVHVPLPRFFTPAQIHNVVAAAGADALACEPADAITRALGMRAADAAPGPGARLYRRAITPAPMHPGTAKVTFTSGSTGQPKGVCLDAPAMLAVAASLAEATATLGIRRHLATLPLAVLLENVAGVYASLLAGASCIVPPTAAAGLTGSSRFDPAALHAAVLATQAHSLILLPQMLQGYAAMLAACGGRAPASLRLVAVGGAALGADALAQAQALGLPAHEGYGLSEGASVQTLNLPGAARPGSAGRPLGHARLRIAGDGEVEVAGTLFLGYLGQPRERRAWLPTGDLGSIDAQGFLHLRGRKKNVLITAFGRNVSPEWVETALCSEAAIAQAVVMGDARPQLGAVLWPRTCDAPHALLQAAVDRANARLPDYARIGVWQRARAPFDAHSGLATANGRPRREAIAALHADLFQGQADTARPAC